MSILAEPIDELPRLPTQDDLPCDDGMPMASQRHLLQMDLLLQGLEPWAAEREDVVVNGNQFLYFNSEHLRARDFRGPDVYVAAGVRPGERKSWVVWQEGNAPDVIIELLSESTAQVDKGPKKQVYPMDWLRWMDADGKLLPVREEQARDQAQSAEQAAEAERARARAETKRAETEKQRADAAEAELARLRAQLGDG